MMMLRRNTGNMKKKVFVLALSLLLISGCGSKIPKLSNGDEAVVTLKGGSMISANELYNNLKNDYALESLINMVDKNILEKKYKKQIKQAKKDADSQMKELEAAYGDGLEQAIQQYTSFSTVDAYKEYIYINNLHNYVIDDYCKAQINDKDINKYYDEEIVGDIKVDHILVTAKVKDDMTDDEKKKAEDEAKNKVKDIIKELKKTDSKNIVKKFTELAKKYSEDEANKENGGSLGFINKDTLSDEYKELVDAAYKLKDKEYSKDVVSTELGYHVILREETKEKAKLKDVKDSIVEALSKEYKEKNPVASVKALQEIRKEYEMKIVDSELKTQYAKYIQSQLSQAQAQANQAGQQQQQQQQAEGQEQ
jgi:parvulin-like peptidyl-prolyl isomerase